MSVPMEVFVSVDMQGVAGITTSWEDAPASTID